jgi:hypothetical protein
MKMLVAGLILTYSAFVLAGKEERTYLSEKAEPAIKKAEADFKASCGGALKTTVPWKDLTIDQMKSVKDTAEAISGGVAAYCKDAGSKKAMQALKSLVFTKGSSNFSFKNGVGTVLVEASSYIPFDMISKEVDK